MANQDVHRFATPLTGNAQETLRSSFVNHLLPVCPWSMRPWESGGPPATKRPGSDSHGRMDQISPVQKFVKNGLTCRIWTRPMRIDDNLGTAALAFTNS